MIDCFLPSEDETQIKFNFPDQESVIVDAIDVANMIDRIRSDTPEDSSIEAEIAREFGRKYNRKVSRTAAGTIWDVVHRVMQDVKKKLYREPEPSVATDTPDSPPENSSSSIG